jgi:hypothetical protein
LHSLRWLPQHSGSQRLHSRRPTPLQRSLLHQLSANLQWDFRQLRQRSNSHQPHRSENQHSFNRPSVNLPSVNQPSVNQRSGSPLRR